MRLPVPTAGAFAVILLIASGDLANATILKCDVHDTTESGGLIASARNKSGHIEYTRPTIRYRSPIWIDDERTYEAWLDEERRKVYQVVNVPTDKLFVTANTGKLRCPDGHGRHPGDEY